MLGPLNLYILTRQNDFESFNFYRRLLSRNSDYREIQEHEYLSLKKFVEDIQDKMDIEFFNGFYYSYIIDQIGKEFDLLKFNQKYCLNIELKSDYVSEEKKLKQLLRNQYYLEVLGLELLLISIDTKNKKYYILNSGHLESISLDEIINKITDMGIEFYDDLPVKLTPTQFLISPLNTPEKFLNGNYFLTNNQEEIKKKILSLIYNKEDSPLYINIRGIAGTGKTLLIYDLIKTIELKSLVLHCGSLSKGHEKLDEQLDTEIRPMKAITREFNLEKYEIIFIDETQRIYISQLILLLNHIKERNKIIIMSADENQILSQTEIKNNVVEKIESLQNIQIYHLSEKIRTNQNMFNFISKLFNLNLKHKIHNENIEILLANDIQEANLIIDLYKKMNYVFIGITNSIYKSSTLDNYYCDLNTHKVIGQEFDNVIMIMDHHFQYNESRMLRAKNHPNPDYLFRKLLLQGLTRVRENLVIVVVNNNELFVNITSIFET